MLSEISERIEARENMFTDPHLFENLRYSSTTNNESLASTATESTRKGQSDFSITSQTSYATSDDDT